MYGLYGTYNCSGLQIDIFHVGFIIVSLICGHLSQNDAVEPDLTNDQRPKMYVRKALTRSLVGGSVSL